jgi:uncharacterized protein YqgC (DUF456 family)
MTRLGTIMFAAFGAVFGGVWGFFFPSPFDQAWGIIIGALIGGGLMGAISYSWEIKEIGK